ncbi:hypothetical protein K439DRAFT_1621837 [Ramaria rubella]|nr:hypothetical protein K439DRAFT_1621837 [Ramaria rubella]
MDQLTGVTMDFGFFQTCGTADKSSQELKGALGEDEEATDVDLPPWILLRKENRSFAIVKTKEMGPEGWDLVQVRSKGCSSSDGVMLYLSLCPLYRTHMPIPAEVYEVDRWWENSPSPCKPQGRKQHWHTSSNEEDVLDETNLSKKCKRSSKGKQLEIRESSDHEDNGELGFMG